MAVLNVLEFPDPRLRTVAEAVTRFEEGLAQLAEDMLETMYADSGIGLAATQVNVHQRLLVVDVSEDKSAPSVYVNPEFEVTGEYVESQEGCLSIPGFYENVQRAGTIRVKAQDVHGEAFEEDCADLKAIVIQHELDHLNGKLFVDYLSPLKRQRIRKKLEKQQRLQSQAG